MLYFSWLMLQITLQYVPIQDDIAFLRIKQHVIDVRPWKVAFFIHVYASMFALLAGFTQFAPGILKGAPAIHRWIGRIYVFDVLFVTGPAGLLMAFYANGGSSSQAAFGLLAALWIFTTARAWRSAAQRRFGEHRNWMIRSYSLTLAAVALRGWKWMLVLMLAPRPMDLYRLVAWLGWIPNLIIAEIIIRRTASDRGRRSTRI